MHQLRLLKANINQLKDPTSLKELSVAGAAAKRSPHEEQEVIFSRIRQGCPDKIHLYLLRRQIPEFSHNPYLSLEFLRGRVVY